MVDVAKPCASDAVFSSSFQSSGAFSTPEGLSAEGLLIYLQTRMGGLDEQINGIFAQQKKNEAVRAALMEIQTQLSQLNDDTANKSCLEGCSTAETKINQAIDTIAEHDPALAEKIRADLNQEGQILFVQDGKYLTSEVAASQEYVNNITKQIESNAQIEMIRLQSLMSSRQTAVQLSTNLVSAVGEGPRAIANNIGK